jgi:hypothetical protein
MTKRTRASATREGRDAGEHQKCARPEARRYIGLIAILRDMKRGAGT